MHHARLIRDREIESAQDFNRLVSRSFSGELRGYPGPVGKVGYVDFSKKTLVNDCMFLFCIYSRSSCSGDVAPHKVCHERLILFPPVQRNTAVKWIASLVCMSAAMLASAGTSQAGNCVPCGGCSDPCAASASTHAAGCQCGGTALAAGCLGAGAAGALDGATFTPDLGPVAEQLCQPIQGYKVVMESQYVTESRPVLVWKTREETRYRTKTVYNTVPVTETKYRTKTVNVPKTETKTVTYSELVPVKTEKTLEVTETVPVWKEAPEEYTVRVPQLVEVPEKYTVKVPKLQEETFTYTVNVPQVVTEQRVHTVMNAVPVTKTRTVQVCVPTTSMQEVTKDYGHWEEQMVPAPAATMAAGGGPGSYARRGGSSGRGGLLSRLFGHHHGRSGGCGSGCASSCAPAPACSSCGTANCGGCGATSASGLAAGAGCTGPDCAGAAAAGAGAAGAGAGAAGAGVGGVGMAGSANCPMVIKKVWVPNVVTEQVPVTTQSMQDQVVSYTVYEQQATQVPYECAKLVYSPESRTGTRKVCVYGDEERTRMRKVVKYTNETRTRTRKQLTYENVTKTITYPHVTYTAEQRTKEVSYTYNVPECSTEAYTVCRYDRVPEEQIEEYTVCVPYCEMQEQQVQVCKMVPRLVEDVLNVCCDDEASVAAGACGGDGGAGCGDSSCGCGGKKGHGLLGRLHSKKSDCGCASSSCSSCCN